MLPSTATLRKRLREKLGTAEQQFIEKVTKRPCRVYRHGWPDFLVELGDGRTMAIEVKDRGDMIRASQRRMFAALERLRIRVMIWTPERPDRLTPWRKFRGATPPNPERAW